MIESNKTICKRCKELKIRIEDGKYPDSKNKRYKDETGKLWNGKVCSQCVVNLSKERMKSFRFNKKLRELENEKEKGT